MCRTIASSIHNSKVRRRARAVQTAEGIAVLQAPLDDFLNGIDAEASGVVLQNDRRLSLREAFDPLGDIFYNFAGMGGPSGIAGEHVPVKILIAGVMIFVTSEFTIFVKAVPITTPTAMSITFPLEINFLNSRG